MYYVIWRTTKPTEYDISVSKSYNSYLLNYTDAIKVEKYTDAIKAAKKIVSTGLAKVSGIITEYAIGDENIDKLIYIYDGVGKNIEIIRTESIECMSDNITPYELLLKHDFEVENIDANKYAKCNCCGLYYVQETVNEFTCVFCQEVLDLGIPKDKIEYCDLDLGEYL